MIGDREHRNECSCKITHYEKGNVKIENGFIKAYRSDGTLWQMSKFIHTSDFLNQFLKDYHIEFSK